VQLDEPVLTELVFTQGKTRTFMCAALSARNDPGEELEFAVGLVNRVAEASNGMRLGLHVCRGNWSTNEDTLLRGSYHPLAPWFARMRVDQLVLEYATPRAGDLVPVGDKELGLGVVNPRTPDVESVDTIVARARAALAVVPCRPPVPEPRLRLRHLRLAPRSRTPDGPTAKLTAIARAAEILRS
jgi:5-methyltetrahydropteroyltriglutamate--homocysteine methyltransferase